jgi:hypothetical protein
MKYAKEIIIGFILFYFTILIAIEISSLKEEIKKNEIEIIELKKLNDKNQRIISGLVIEKDMLETAVDNIVGKDISQYPLSMQDMIKAAKNHNKIEFDFYIRLMKKENKLKN